tara:strand:- start:98 stop:244 length:147 start_codon:yes stop_codon:yes gene_type:complete
MNLEDIIQLWPIAVAFVSLVIVLAKMYNRIDTLEEKVKTLFELWNSKK